jgi:hypothetical protein
MCIDRTSTDAVQSLKLPGSAKVVPLDIKIKSAKRNDQGNEDGCSDGYNYQGETSCVAELVIDRHPCKAIITYLERSLRKAY